MISSRVHTSIPIIDVDDWVQTFLFNKNQEKFAFLCQENEIVMICQESSQGKIYNVKIDAVHESIESILTQLRERGKLRIIEYYIEGDNVIVNYHADSFDEIEKASDAIADACLDITALGYIPIIGPSCAE